MAPNNGWFDTTIGDQVQLQRGKDITKNEQRPGSTPVVSSGGISSYHDTAFAKSPGVILGRKGTLGTVFYLDHDYWPHDTTLWVKDFKGNNPRFVYYFFKAMSADLLALDVGTANPTLNRNHVHPIETLWPRQVVQDRICEVLGQIDDKIELNRRINETMEATARAVFRSWFVDFDPVIAKVEDRQPAHMSADTVAFFPDHFEDSPIGPLPAGWTPGSTTDIAQYVNGRNFTKDATGTGRMVIRIAELNSGPGASTKYNEVDADPVNTAYPNDILFAWSGSLDVYRWHRDEALVNQHIFKVVCDKYPKWFVFFQLQEAMPFFQDIAADKATTMGHIKRHHLSESELVIPCQPLLDHGTTVIQPLYDRIHTNERESMTLARIRDTLLPKLLSGAIRLRDAEKAVGEVAV